MDNRPILPNWRFQHDWLESIGWWDAWLETGDCRWREHIPEGEEGCLTEDERAKLQAFQDLQKRMETMERPWDKELGIVRPARG